MTYIHNITLLNYGHINTNISENWAKCRAITLQSYIDDVQEERLLAIISGY